MPSKPGFQLHFIHYFLETQEKIPKNIKPSKARQLVFFLAQKFAEKYVEYTAWIWSFSFIAFEFTVVLVGYTIAVYIFVVSDIIIN